MFNLHISKDIYGKMYNTNKQNKRFSWSWLVKTYPAFINSYYFINSLHINGEQAYLRSSSAKKMNLGRLGKAKVRAKTLKTRKMVLLATVKMAFFGFLG